MNNQEAIIATVGIVVLLAITGIILFPGTGWGNQENLAGEARLTTKPLSTNEEALSIIQGHVDTIDAEQTTGWAYNTRNPAKPLTIRAYIDGTLAAQTQTPELYR